MATLKSTLPLLTLTLASQASAWGALGHNTVAYIAQSFLLPQTAKYTQRLLNDTSNAYLANIATWADSYRSQPGGAFSSPFHYIDALDSPPESCNVDFERDCPEEGCIVSAIANYTARFQEKDLDLVERQKALKWVVHFLGDIHQPLHVENLAVGGNLINVTFNNATTNLHRIWDSNIPEKLIGGFDLEDAEAWSKTLIGEIKTGKYANATKVWVQGMSANDSIASAMHWATDSNAYVCSTVVPEGQEGVENKELSGEYYDDAIPVVQMQIAKAGVRLAAWLNLVVTGKTGVKGGKGGYHVGGNKMDGGLVKRGSGELELEAWMVEARRVRRAYGWDCGHEH
ncbi:hypothetical protein K458DRAFT_407457 [Lentithecium fluviatile CBS 122367]|uniref:Nuclease PA3 n=1 Tax=Lentithecium fluviatile CBS 122367 TaxID=1168545 RepID=A0A6G1IQB1_9PLEO|nr:hypothetical protein K458DRAFT_407457 [Lentithecium fluviatile CBS 122367]